MGGNLVALHNPFDGGFAVDDVLIGGFGNVFDGYTAVVNDFGFVGF